MRWEFEAAQACDLDGLESQIVGAWQTVRIWLKAHKKDGRLQMPKLDKLLDEVRRKPATAKTQLSDLVLLGSQYRIPMRDATAEEVAAAKAAQG